LDVIACAAEPCRSDSETPADVRQLALNAMADPFTPKAPEWFGVPRALLSHGVDAHGRFVHEYYAPTLREILERLLTLEHVIFVDERLALEPWVATDRSHSGALAELSVESDAALDPHDGQEVFIDGRLEMTAWWYSLAAERVLGVLQAKADGDACDRTYRGREEIEMQRDLRRAAFAALQRQAATRWPGPEPLGPPAEVGCGPARDEPRPSERPPGAPVILPAAP
jgi:hypothetical protein